MYLTLPVHPPFQREKEKAQAILSMKKPAAPATTNQTGTEPEVMR